MGKWKTPAQIILLILLTYFLLRLIFYVLYFKDFDIGAEELGKMLAYGSRLDLAVIILVNTPFLLMYRYGQSIIPQKTRTSVFLGLICLLNIPLLIVNYIDLVYYPFNQRRSTIDLLKVAGAMQESTMLTFFFRYWQYSTLAVVSIIALLVSFARILRRTTGIEFPSLKKLIYDIPVWLMIFFLVRGVGNKPLMPSTPLIYFQPQYQELVNNSSLTLLYSTIRTQTSLKPLNYFTDATADSIYNVTRHYTSDSPSHKNVVVFIIESLSKRYLDKNDVLKTYTPFLDSIIPQSTYCENAFATGFESNKSLVSILMGIPSLLDEPLYYSPYANARFKGLGHELSARGYQTSFFMACEYDNFGFAKAAKMAGIEEYYSMETYGSNTPHDGTWGIFDSYFFPYFRKQLNGFREPFLSVIFNLSTHDPYNLPPEDQKRFQIKGQNAAQNAVSYYDDVLAKFFREAQHEPWFRNTIFVFTADHSSWITADRKAPLYKQYAIPIIFFDPGKKGKKHTTLTTLTDIVPTLHQMLGTGSTFVSFGKSIYDTTHRLIVSRRNYLYESMNEEWILGYNDNTDKPIYFYHYTVDPSLKNNLVSDSGSAVELKRMTDLTRAYLQQYKNRLISKNLLPEN